MEHPHKTAVIGIGNPLRADDALGLLVAREFRRNTALNNQVANRVAVLESNGDPGELLEHFTNFANIYLIDAVRSDSIPPGTVIRLEGTSCSPPYSNPHSTHAIPLDQIIALASALDQLPQKLVIYGIAGQDFDYSDSLNQKPPERILLAIRQLAKRITDELKSA